MIEIRADIKRVRNETHEEYIRRISDILTEYESLSEGHIRWFTHKNPYGCWICDLLSTFREFLTEVSTTPEFDTVERPFEEYSEEETENYNVDEETQVDNS